MTKKERQNEKKKEIGLNLQKLAMFMVLIMVERDKSDHGVNVFGGSIGGGGGGGCGDDDVGAEIVMVRMEKSTAPS